MSKILLVQPRYNYIRDFLEAPSMALLILGTLAESEGHQVKLLHLDIDKVDLRHELLSFAPDILGITVNTFQVKSAKRVIEVARSVSSSIKIVVGGPHAAFEEWSADLVVIGEGENVWLEILEAERRISSVDDVPLLDYDLVDVQKFRGHPPRWVTPAMIVMTSRGCPFQCTFCNTPVFWGKKVRYRAPELVVAEIEWLYVAHGVREVTFQDDTFNLNHAWAMEVFDRVIEKGLSEEVLFRITSRVNEKLVTKEFLDLACEAGVWQIFYGVESGSQYMLDRMKKGVTVAEIKRAVAMTKEAGIAVYCSFVVGLPGETVGTLTETRDLIEEIQPDSYNWAFACPFPGTEFEREVTAAGHKLNVPFEEYGYGNLLARTDELTFEHLLYFDGFV